MLMEVGALVDGKRELWRAFQSWVLFHAYGNRDTGKAREHQLAVWSLVSGEARSERPAVTGGEQVIF